MQRLEVLLRKQAVQQAHRGPSHLCERLVEMGHDVICLDNFFTSQKTNVAHLLDRPNFDLIRHVQILVESLKHAQTKAYVKIGTSGTGGMGLNIPYTHSEERPSRTLMAKSAVAGAQSMFLYLLGRTPGAPAIARAPEWSAKIAPDRCWL